MFREIKMQNNLFNQDLIKNINGDLFVNSLDIADNVQNQHKNVISLIKGNLQELEEFGGVAFKTEPFNTNGGVQNREVCYLNENQVTFLITLMRNNNIVKNFKLNLVKAFSIMKANLQKQNLPTHLETAKMLVQVLEDKERLLETNRQLEKQNTILMHTNNLYTATELAKEVGLKSANSLNAELHKRKIQYKVNKNWVLYSQYADLGYTSIKQTVLDSGRVIYDRKFTQTGRDFILKLFSKELV